MINRFANKATEDIYNGRSSRVARQLCHQNVWPVAVRKLDMLDAAESIDDLKVPPGNRLEALRGDRRGQYSIRINGQYRICFRWGTDGPTDVEIADYH